MKHPESKEQQASTRESVKRSQIDAKRKTRHIRTWGKTFIS
jgi:hypothetical protein